VVTSSIAKITPTKQYRGYYQANFGQLTAKEGIFLTFLGYI